MLLQTVLDGDSLAVERNGQRTEVRLVGINTPESDECYGNDARTLMQDLVSDEVILVPVAGEDDRDQFGRLLRDVWVGGTWLNLRMIEAGAALALQSGHAERGAGSSPPKTLRGKRAKACGVAQSAESSHQACVSTTFATTRRAVISRTRRRSSS